MRPIIGVPLRYSHLEDGRAILYIGERIRRTLQNAGGEVFSLTPVQDVDYVDTKGNEFPKLTEAEKRIINKNLDKCDGLFLPGGTKFTPYDRYILEYAIEKKIPTLAVCLSMQMMSCYQEDVKLEKNDTNINHRQQSDYEFSHKVLIDRNSRLYDILQKEEISVNSFHNYHGTNNCIYNTVAKSEDGLIEGLEYPGDFFNIGVQWHPEISYDFDENSRKIINAFIEQSKIRQELILNESKKEINILK